MKILGVYDVEGENNVWLIDVLIEADTRNFDFDELTQSVTSLERDKWQLAYDERMIGTTDSGERWVFFFHHLDFHRSLKTPFGDIALPSPVERPRELSSIVYEAPC